MKVFCWWNLFCIPRIQNSAAAEKHINYRLLRCVPESRVPVEVSFGFAGAGLGVTDPRPVCVGRCSLELGGADGA